MNSFLYFIETDKQRATLEDIAKWGFDYTLETNDFRQSRLALVDDDGNRLPDVQGLVLGDPKRFTEENGEGDQIPRYDAIKADVANQVWKAMPMVDGVRRWIGWYKDAMPTSVDLQREKIVPGQPLHDAMDDLWLIPLIRSCGADLEPKSKLPCYYDIDDQGALIEGPIVDRYRHLWDITEEPWEKMKAGKDVTNEECWPVLCEIMAANYRVSAVELAVMKVFSPAAMTSPSGWIALAMDYFTARKWFDTADCSDPLKPQPGTDGESIADGQKVDTPATSQPVQTN